MRRWWVEGAAPPMAVVRHKRAERWAEGLFRRQLGGESAAQILPFTVVRLRIKQATVKATQHGKATTLTGQHGGGARDNSGAAARGGVRRSAQRTTAPVRWPQAQSAVLYRDGRLSWRGCTTVSPLATEL